MSLDFLQKRKGSLNIAGKSAIAANGAIRGRTMFDSGTFMKIRNGLVLLMAGAALAACSNVPDPQSPVPDVSSFSNPVQTPILNAGDSIKIIAFGADNLSGDYKLAANGQLDLGKYGKIGASGLPAAQLEEAIAARLAEKGLTGVRVSVMTGAG